MAEHGPTTEPVGSVAEETARLVEALGAWAGGLGGSGGPAREGEPSADRGPHSAAADQDDAGTAPQRGRTGPGDEEQSRCGRCGAPGRVGEALTCQLCPLCQGINVLRAVRPETVERLADLASALASALRDVAADRHRRPHAPPPPRGQRVQDIEVRDEDVARTEPPTDQREQESDRP